jgi:hypothetical protein
MISCVVPVSPSWGKIRVRLLTPAHASMSVMEFHGEHEVVAELRGEAAGRFDVDASGDATAPDVCHTFASHVFREAGGIERAPGSFRCKMILQLPMPFGPVTRMVYPPLCRALYRVRSGHSAPRRGRAVLRASPCWKS